MKTSILIAACVVLVGCGRRGEESREILSNLEAIKHEIATNTSTSPRWAVARRRDIQFAIDRWSQPKIEEAAAAESLSPEQAEKVKQYEALNNQLMRMRMPRPYMGAWQGNPGMGLPRTFGDDTNREAQLEALSARVEQARAPIASILDHRARKAAQIRSQYTPDNLVADYVGDRFDLVVDSSDLDSFNPPVLYQRNREVLDITDGVLKLFQEKSKQ